MRSYHSYIGGQDIPSESWVYTLTASSMLDDFLSNLKLKRRLEKTGQLPQQLPNNVIARTSIASEAQLQASLESAKNASIAWADFSIESRLSLAKKFHQRVIHRKKEFIDVLIAEGHPRLLAEWEIAGILQCTSPQSIELWREQLYQSRQIGQRRLLLVRKPDGVVALSPPQNAAASNSVGGLAALVAGNSLIVKAPRSCPLGVMYVWRDLIAPILEEIGAPPGTLNIICGNPNVILPQWLQSPLVDDIFFFGGSARGIELGKEAVKAGKKPVLELAGNDGCIIWEDADIPRAAQALTECFYGSGQICMVPKYAIVHPKVADALLKELTHLTQSIKPGKPESQDALLSPVLRSDAYFKYLAEAKAAGGKILTGGYRMELDAQPCETGPFIAPTIVKITGLDLASSMPCVRDETFFPLLPVVIPQTPEEATLERVIEFVNANPYGLRNSFWSESHEVIETVSKRITNGGLLKINDSHIGFTPWLATHGGTGLTGGPFGELNYPLLRTSHLQGISIGYGIDPKRAVFESALNQNTDLPTNDTIAEVVAL